MSNSLDYFNDFIRGEYNLDSLLNNNFKRENGEFNGANCSKIIRTLNKCLEEESNEDVKNELVDYIETHILECESRVLSAIDFKNNLSKNNDDYYWKKNVEFFFISSLRKKIIKLSDWVECNSELNTVPPNQKIKKQSNYQKLKNILIEYGFFNLPKIKSLTLKDQYDLVQNLSEGKIPYIIAMFDYLEFLDLLKKQYFKSSSQLNIELSSWFDSDKNGRRVRGNINVLHPKTVENKKNYTAHLYIEKVKNDYDLLK